MGFRFARVWAYNYTFADKVNWGQWLEDFDHEKKIFRIAASPIKTDAKMKQISILIDLKAPARSFTAELVSPSQLKKRKNHP